MEDTDEKLPAYTNLLCSLEIEERSRPVQDQFPMLKDDFHTMSVMLDKMTVVLDKMVNRTDRLFQSEINLSDEMEEVALHSFCREIEKSDSMLLPDIMEFVDGIIYRLDKPTERLVQWDGIVSLNFDDTDNVSIADTGIQRLFLIETKRISHPLDIFRKDNDIDKEKDLYTRGIRMYKYIRELQTLKKGVAYKSKHRLQHSAFKEMLNHRMTVVYASGMMKKDVTDELLSLKKRFDDGGFVIDVWSHECPRMGNGNTKQY
jgi:hypothetical protein